jgi:hypothetical protein
MAIDAAAAILLLVASRHHGDSEADKRVYQQSIRSVSTHSHYPGSLDLTGGLGRQRATT